MSQPKSNKLNTPVLTLGLILLLGSIYAAYQRYVSQPLIQLDWQDCFLIVGFWTGVILVISATPAKKNTVDEKVPY